MGGTLDDYRTHVDAAGWRPRTIEQRLYQLRALADHVGRDPATATTDDIATWLARDTLGASARATYLDALRGYYRWLIDTGRRADDPTRPLGSIRRRRAIPRPAPPEAIRDGIAAATGDLRVQLMLCYYAGLRCAEVAALHGEDITDSTIFIRDGKGGKQAMVPLHPALRTALAHYPTSGPLWDVTYKRLSQRISDHFRRIGHPGVTAHRLRHAFGTNVYLNSGKDLRMTQELLRHSSPTTTAIYTAVDIDESAAVIGRLTA